MARVWPFYDGRYPTRVKPWADIPLLEAIRLFDLRPEHFLSDLEHPPRFGNQDQDLTYQGFKHVAVEIGHNEGQTAKWRPGFYRSPVRPKAAFGKLIQRAFVTELGAENVLRVEYKTATDSQGEEALKIVVVIAPNAIKKFAGGASLNALVRLREWLNEIGDSRIPLVEYATETELAV
jgi:hypothetical protein